MKRIYVYYEGVPYTIAGRELRDVKDEIERALATGAPHWLKVNHGEGTLRETEVLIAKGVGIALIPIKPGSEDRLEAAPVVLPGPEL
jgi:hypothetical protein